MTTSATTIDFMAKRIEKLRQEASEIRTVRSARIYEFQQAEDRIMKIMKALRARPEREAEALKLVSAQRAGFDRMLAELDAEIALGEAAIAAAEAAKPAG